MSRPRQLITVCRFCRHERSRLCSMSSRCGCKLHSPRGTAGLRQQPTGERSARSGDGEFGLRHLPRCSNTQQHSNPPPCMSWWQHQIGGRCQWHHTGSPHICDSRHRSSSLGRRTAGVIAPRLLSREQKCVVPVPVRSTVPFSALKDESHALLTLRHFLSWPGMPRHLMQRLPSGLHFWQPVTASVQRTHWSYLGHCSRR